MNLRPARVLFALAPLLLAGCVTDGPYNDGYSRSSPTYYDRDQDVGAQQVFYGQVIAVRPVAIGRANTPGVGAVLGAVVGGVVGNQFGHGGGRELATVGGAVAGGFAGNSIQNATDRRMGQELEIQLQDGHVISIVQDAQEVFYQGDHVRVLGYGRSARVVH
jgi:outer membrane lipoprotein SlyB